MILYEHLHSYQSRASAIDRGAKAGKQRVTCHHILSKETDAHSQSELNDNTVPVVLEVKGEALLD